MKDTLPEKICQNVDGCNIPLRAAKKFERQSLPSPEQPTHDRRQNRVRQHPHHV